MGEVPGLGDDFSGVFFLSITRILLVNKLGIAEVLSRVSCRQSRLVGVTARRCDDPGGNSSCEGSLLVYGWSLWVVWFIGYHCRGVVTQFIWWVSCVSFTCQSKFMRLRWGGTW